MDWGDLRFVLAVARAGTLAAAARRLGVNQTTVARRLEAAETALGTRLFERVDGALHPTASGEEAIARASQVEEDVEALALGIGGADAEPAGLVRVSTVPVLVNHLLVPALPRLLARHPELRIALIGEGRNANLMRREADVALRLARPESGGSVLAKRLGDLEYAIYVPCGWNEKDLRWISYEEGMRHLPQARWIEQAERQETAAPASFNDMESVLHAVHAGLGKAVLPRFVADHDPRLQRVDAFRPPLRREVWLLTHPRTRHAARVDAVVDWMTEVVNAALLPV